MTKSIEDINKEIAALFEEARLLEQTTQNTKLLQQKLALKTISQKLKDLDNIILECEAIADKAGVEFSWEGPVYGMGGYYNPAEDGWMSSSESC